MARMNISVPDGLKKQMDEAASEVNWSQVATQAFELKFGELIEKRAKEDMRAVIERLRVSKRNEETKSHQDGHKAGIRWAKEKASFVALSNLHAWWKSRLLELQRDKRKPASWEEVVAAAIGQKQLETSIRGHSNAPLAFLDGAMNCSSDDLPQDSERNADWLSGFVTGAFQVYELIRDEL